MSITKPDFPGFTRDIERKITQCESFSELASLIFTTASWVKYTSQIQEKVQSLPIEASPNFINAVGFLDQHEKANQPTDQGFWSSILDTYCNRLVNEGLLDNLAVEDTLSNFAAIVVLLYRGDRSRIHDEYLAITVSAILGYENAPFYNYLAMDNEVTIARKYFLQSVENIPADVSNCINDEEAKWDTVRELLSDLRQNFEYDHMTKLVDKAYWEFYHNEEITGKVDHMDPDDFWTIISYLVVTLKTFIVCKVTRNMPPILVKAIQKEWVDAQKVIVEQIPYPDEEVRYKILDRCIFYAWIQVAYSIKNNLTSRPNEDNWITEEYVEILHDCIGGMNLQYHPSENTPVTEAKSMSAREFDQSNDRDTDNDEHEEEDTDDNDSDDQPYTDKDARKSQQKVKVGNYDKNSSAMDKASRKIYNGYRAYRDNVEKVDSQISKLIQGMKNRYAQSTRDQIIEGKQFSMIRILKKLMTTAAIFSYSKVAGVLYIIVKYFRDKKVTNRERVAMLQEIELEIKMLDEKIEDARGDGNRKAKYAMMRTRAELQKSYEQIKYGLTAGAKAMQTAKDLATGKITSSYNRGRDS